MPAVVLHLDMLFYVRQYLGLQETSLYCFGIGGSMEYHCHKQQDRMHYLRLQLPTHIVEEGGIIPSQEHQDAESIIPLCEATLLVLKQDEMGRYSLNCPEHSNLPGPLTTLSLRGWLPQ